MMRTIDTSPPKLSRGARALYAHLRELQRVMREPGQRYSWPSQAELGAQLECTAASIRRHLAELEAAGLVKRVRWQRGCRYYFLDVQGDA